MLYYSWLDFSSQKGLFVTGATESAAKRPNPKIVLVLEMRAGEVYHATA